MRIIREGRPTPFAPSHGGEFRARQLPLGGRFLLFGAVSGVFAVNFKRKR
ncbi:MAG: hypothetical protein LBP62_01310 [Clostridiales bacterium]|nr:hypothetical protein [Clostridiales bacterium]